MAVILISSPAAAPVAVISIPPAEAVKTTADAPLAEDAILTDVDASISNVEASISIATSVVVPIFIPPAP